MWYFAWILGTGLAICFGVLNALWHEAKEGRVEYLKPENLSKKA